MKFYKNFRPQPKLQRPFLLQPNTRNFTKWNGSRILIKSSSNSPLEKNSKKQPQHLHQKLPLYPFAEKFFQIKFLNRNYRNRYESALSIKWGASSRWSSSLFCLMRNSDKMTIGKMHPTLKHLIWTVRFIFELRVIFRWVHSHKLITRGETRAIRSRIWSSFQVETDSRELQWWSVLQS